jgi:isopenicillin-N epimerase
MVASLKSEYLLAPDVIFLNHGGYGACPKPVFAEYQRWQLELERQPVEFLGRRITALMAEARAALAAYLGVDAGTLIYFPNPTTAMNMVARSLALRPGDEILSTDHEYGALDRTWHLCCKQARARYIRRPIPLPVTSPAEFVEAFWSGVNERTRAVYLSHITSPTALIFPINEICRRAREAGILSLIDGAHAPGQIPVNLAEIDADVYVGACHKWLSSPKGSAFLYARPDVQPWLEPLVVSWGWGDDVIAPDLTLGETEFVRFHQWQGTRDMAAFLATPAAIQFQARHNWGAVQAECHALAREARAEVEAFTGLDPISPDSPEWFGQMVSVRLPEAVDVNALKSRLYDEYRIEVPVFRWNDQPFIRASFQAYNSWADREALLNALKDLL